MELNIAILILAVLIGTFSLHALKLLARAEKSMIDRTVLNINTALNYRASFAVMKHDLEVLNQLLIMNPMNMMMSRVGTKDIVSTEKSENSLLETNNIAHTPTGYNGEVFDDSDPLLESGRWYYDQDDGFLFYKLNNEGFFISDIDGPARVRFKVRLNFIDQDNNNSFDPISDKFKSIKLQAIDKYEWSF